MSTPVIPPAEVQLEILERGTADLEPRAELKARLEHSHRTQKPLKIKAGFDPTAPDLHLGHSVLMEKMAQFQRLGHEIIFVVGDYTALIGDPTGRNALRPPLSPEQILENARTYTDQCFKLLDRERTRVVWNSSWLGKLSFHDVISLAARYNVGRMLERRDFKARFEQGKQIAMHELLYPLMQGYDSVALENDVELGGHDQIFNLLVGRHLMEAYGQKPQIVMTVSLLVGLDGVEKMSKSKGNHVGITEPADDMFGKIMSISDETMPGWYERLLPSTPATPDPLAAKKALAQAMVARFHGAPAADDTLAWWNAGRPPRNLDEAEVDSGPLYEVLAAAGLADSRSDARRKITQGGVTVGEAKMVQPNTVIAPGEYLVRVGKKTSKRVRVRDGVVPPS
jgi:tyrosyl-tRNA synthetase